MKKILIVIYDMRIGGAQKSLLSFLQELSAADLGAAYDVHVMPMNPVGEFLSQIPSTIHIDHPPRVLQWMGTRMNWRLLRRLSIRGLAGEIAWMFRKKLGLLPSKLNNAQKVWYSWHDFVPCHEERWDVAIAYIDGSASYYVMDKVQADKKIMWLHSDYEKQGYQPAYDARYYQACDAVITVSKECRDAVTRALPQYAEKVHVLENISSVRAVLERSRESVCAEYVGFQGLKLLTVARLNEQKGIDLAVEAAKCLKEAKLDFLWLIVGEGAQRARLEEMIRQYGLEGHFQLIGSRENPYTYMRECDILVQPSRVEGKSIVLDEAKILCKPIVVTAYPTVADAISHAETGWITGMTGEEIAEGILKLAQDDALRQRMIDRLQQLPKGNEQELQRYLDLMF